MVPAAAVWVLVLLYPGLDTSLHFTSKESCNAFLTTYSADYIEVYDGCSEDGGGTCGFCVEAKNLATDKRGG